MPREKPWPDAWTEELKALWPTGLSCSQIAARMGKGLTRNAIIGRAHRLDLERRGRPVTTKPKKIRNRRSPRRTTREERTAFSLPPIDIEALRCAVVDPLHLALADLEPHQCRYPYGGGPYTFCGLPKLEPYSYCGAHLVLCCHEAGPNAGRARPDASVRSRKALLPTKTALFNINEDEAA